MDESKTPYGSRVTTRLPFDEALRAVAAEAGARLARVRGRLGG